MRDGVGLHGEGGRAAAKLTHRSFPSSLCSSHKRWGPYLLNCEINKLPSPRSLSICEMLLKGALAPWEMGPLKYHQNHAWPLDLTTARGRGKEDLDDL